MNTSLSWIKAYVPDLDVTAQEYTDAMTLSGTKVEGYEKLDADLDKIVIGQIDKIEKHPDADKLIICQVNVGTETIQIVTGAPNVKEGDKVPVVLAGGRVAGGHEPGQRVEGGIKIKKGKLRGVESDGMMCSIEELGSNRDMYPEAPEYGIYILDDDAVVGESAIKSLGLDDVVVEYEITSNRVDCFSVVGIAREAAATFNKAFYPPVVTPTGNDENAADYIKVTVKNPELCPRYCARIVKNIKIGPSPKWMQRRLASVGIRPINNLVDIRVQFTLGMYGEGDFFTMKGVVEEFFDKVGLHKKEKYDPNAGKSFLHPGRQANIIYDGVVVGYLGEVHPEVADNYGIGTRAYIAVIDMPEIVARATFDRKYTGIAKFPAVTRDISMVMPKEILVGQIEDVIESKGGEYLESYSLFDIYEGAQIKTGFKSVAYSIVFRAKDKTLEDADVSAAMDRILKALEGMGIELRK